MLHAQDASKKVREIEQKVLQEQYQKAVQSLAKTARDTKVDHNPEIIGKQVQWLMLVGNQIEGGAKPTAANRQEMTENAATLNDLAGRMISSTDPAARHPETALKLATIALEISGEDKSLKPNVLDTKARALFLLGSREEAIAEQEKAVAAATVAEQKAGFEATLAAYQRDELPEVLPAGGVAYITDKLRRIVIPRIEFEDTSLEEAIDFLKLECIKQDTFEPNPAKKGFNFVVSRPVPNREGKSGQGTSKPDAVRIASLNLRNVPVAEALRYICAAANMRYRVDDSSITILDQAAPGERFTRNFNVSSDFVSKLGGRPGANPAHGNGKAQPTFMELLISHGVNFGEGCTATMIAPNTLMVSNTAIELDKIAQLIKAVESGKK